MTFEIGESQLAYPRPRFSQILHNLQHDPTIQVNSFNLDQGICQVCLIRILQDVIRDKNIFILGITNFRHYLYIWYTFLYFPSVSKVLLFSKGNYVGSSLLILQILFQVRVIVVQSLYHAIIFVIWGGATKITMIKILGG